jgi:hypothetical protein
MFFIPPNVLYILFSFSAKNRCYKTFLFELKIALSKPVTIQILEIYFVTALGLQFTYQPLGWMDIIVKSPQPYNL